MATTWLSPEEVATELRVSRRTAYNWIRGGKLKAVRVGHLWRVDRLDLQVFVQSGAPSRAGGRQPVDGRRLIDDLGRLGEEVPAEEWSKLPADLTDNLDHYLYGTPHR